MGGLARDPRIAPAIEKIFSVAGIGAASASTIKYQFVLNSLMGNYFILGQRSAF